MVFTQDGVRVSGSTAVTFSLRGGSGAAGPGFRAWGDFAGAVDSADRLTVEGTLLRDQTIGGVSRYGTLFTGEVQWRDGLLNGQFSVAVPTRFGTVSENRWAVVGMTRVAS